MEQFNKMKLVNLKKRLSKFDCEYSARIIAVIDECYNEECEKVETELRKKKTNYMNTYQCQDVICDCGLITKRSYIYEHKKLWCPVAHKIEKKTEMNFKSKQKPILIESDDDDTDDRTATSEL